MDNKQSQPRIISIFSIGLIRIILVVLLLVVLKNAIWLPAMFLLFLVLSIEGACWWSKYGLRHLKLEKAFTYRRSFPGEKTKLRFKIINNKRWPCIIGWQQAMPEGLHILAGEDGAGIVEKACMLMGHKSHIIEYELQAIKRGYWQIPQTQISSTDGLGLFEQTKSFPDEQWVIVYPELIPLAALDLEVSDLIGEKKVQRPFLPDPIRLVGLREYTSDMPARLIHWKASLAKDQLYAKVLEPSADYKLYLILDVAYFQTEQEAEKFERALSVVASILTWAQEKNIPFGLLINGRQIGLAGPLSLPIGNDMEHLVLALERLARLELVALGPINELWRQASTGVPAGTSFIYLGGNPAKDLPNLKKQVFWYKL